ncbi:hypothetical protein U9M48_019742 [Paspalum notatum var. saurae]|uniref:Uncharacterized protein n=1 Tax=Paspalum notatum var. saurae TaxID=547442 RepID=A0AAQ3WRU8_PASNO
MHRPLGRDLPGSIPRLARPSIPRDQTRRGSPTEDLEHNGDTSRALHSYSSKEEEPSMDLGDPLSAIFGSLTIQDQRTAGMAQQLNQVDERIQVIQQTQDEQYNRLLEIEATAQRIFDESQRFFQYYVLPRVASLKLGGSESTAGYQLLIHSPLLEDEQKFKLGGVLTVVGRPRG